MKKNVIKYLIIFVALLAAFIVLSFTIPFVRTSVYWVGFVAGIVGILLSAIGVYIAFKNGKSAMSRFYGFPVARIAVLYIIVQMIVSFLCMGFAAVIPMWLGLAIVIILFLLALIGFATADSIRDEIEQLDTKLKEQVKNMRVLQSRITVLADQCDDAELKETVKTLARDFKFSDPVSNEAVSDIENQMTALMDEAERAVLDGDNEGAKILLEKLSNMLHERNRICKITK